MIARLPNETLPHYIKSAWRVWCLEKFPISFAYRDLAWLTIYWRVTRPLPQRCIRIGYRIGEWPDRSCRLSWPRIDYVYYEE